MSFLQAPKAPSDHLRRECARILPRLELIYEFRPWISLTQHAKRTTSPFTLLWETFALGASLATLLNLLGSPPPRDLSIDADKYDTALGLPHREKYFTNFIQRVQLLELQQKIPFGEVLRVSWPHVSQRPVHLTRQTRFRIFSVAPTRASPRYTLALLHASVDANCSRC